MSEENDLVQDEAGLESLLHPVYLDVPMMISFLAALRGGVAFEDTLTQRGAQTAKRDTEGQARLRLPSLGSLFGFDASGRVGRSAQDETSEEIQAVRRHTAASLFNALYAALHDEGFVKRTERGADLAGIRPGEIVELSGDFIGNPLEPLTGFFKQAAPLLEILAEGSDVPDPKELAQLAQAYSDEAQAVDRQAAKAERSGSPATRAQALGLRQQAQSARVAAEQTIALLQSATNAEDEKRAQDVGIRMLALVHDDLIGTPVHDTVIKADDYQAVLTMSSEFFTSATRAHLRGGEFRVVGKVTRILAEGEEIDLLRRTVLGAMGSEAGGEFLRTVVADGELKLDVFDPVIQAPALQVLPLAIFT